LGSGIIEALKPLTNKVDATLSRNAILGAHARHEQQQSYTPGKIYCDLLAVVYKRLAEEWGVRAGIEECETYGDSIRHWPVFADSAGALVYLKRHYKLVILSNVDNASFAFSNEKLVCVSMQSTRPKSGLV
jgi:2-haloacid dehalogenase